MKILNWYVTRGFLVAFAMAIGILTFALTGANLVKVLEYVSRGLPLAVFGKFILYILPIVLTFTVPWAVMVAVMLVFGRLSADSEITAMRSCGVSIMQIVSPILILTFGLTILVWILRIEKSFDHSGTIILRRIIHEFGHRARPASEDRMYLLHHINVIESLI